MSEEEEKKLDNMTSAELEEHAKEIKNEQKAESKALRKQHADENAELEKLIKQRKAEEAEKEYHKIADKNKAVIKECNDILGTSDGISVVKSFIEYASKFRVNDGRTIVECFKSDKDKQ